MTSFLTNNKGSGILSLEAIMMIKQKTLKEQGCRFCRHIIWRGKGLKAVGGCVAGLKPDKNCSKWQLIEVK